MWRVDKSVEGAFMWNDEREKYISNCLCCESRCNCNYWDFICSKCCTVTRSRHQPGTTTVTLGGWEEGGNQGARLPVSFQLRPSRTDMDLECRAWRDKRGVSSHVSTTFLVETMIYFFFFIFGRPEETLERNILLFSPYFQNTSSDLHEILPISVSVYGVKWGSKYWTMSFLVRKNTQNNKKQNKTEKHFFFTSSNFMICTTEGKVSISRQQKPCSDHVSLSRIQPILPQTPVIITTVVPSSAPQCSRQYLKRWSSTEFKWRQMVVIHHHQHRHLVQAERYLVDTPPAPTT